MVGIETWVDRLGRGLAGRYYPTEKEVIERVAVISRERRVKGSLRTTVSTDPVTAKPTLEWHFDEVALSAEASTDGWYALLTNLDSKVSTAEVFYRYKGQEALSQLQGPDCRRAYVFKEQSPYRGTYQRHLPSTAHL